MKRAVYYLILPLWITAILSASPATRCVWAHDVAEPTLTTSADAKVDTSKDAAARAKPEADVEKVDAKLQEKPTAKQEKKNGSPKKPSTKESKEPKDSKPTTDAGKPSATEKKPAEGKPATHTVRRGPFQVEVALDGVFEAQQMTELAVRPEAWTAFSVLDAVEHGADVNKGDVLIRFDPEKIDRAIDDLRSEHKAADLAIKLAQQQLAVLEKSTPMNLAAGARSNKNAHEDFDYYFRVLRPLAERMAEFSLKSSQRSLEYEEEELKQLERMYKADDLTEETEEIVLKRARNNVEMARFFVERAKIFHERTTKVEIPRDDETMKESMQEIDLQWSSGKITLPLALQKQRVDLEKLKLARTRSEEQLKKLLADRDAMTIKAPESGTVYYGRCVRGKFGSASSTGDGLRRGATVAPNDVFMTLVQPRPMLIRVSVPEDQIQNVRTGTAGTAQPACCDDLKLTAVVERVASVPMSSGGFDGRLTVAIDPKESLLMPGMTCKVKLTAYQNKNAIAVPKEAVGTDETDPDRHYVCMAADGKREKRSVTLGKRNDKHIEILAGLSEGDKILLECPKE